MAAGLHDLRTNEGSHLEMPVIGAVNGPLACAGDPTARPGRRSERSRHRVQGRNPEIKINSARTTMVHAVGPALCPRAQSA